jgi:hypothetical protein
VRVAAERIDFSDIPSVFMVLPCCASGALEFVKFFTSVRSR